MGPGGSWLSPHQEAHGGTITSVNLLPSRGEAAKLETEWSQGRWLMLFKFSQQLTDLKQNIFLSGTLHDPISQWDATILNIKITQLFGGGWTQNKERQKHGGSLTWAKPRCHDCLPCCRSHLVRAQRLGASRAEVSLQQSTMLTISGNVEFSLFCHSRIVIHSHSAYTGLLQREKMTTHQSSLFKFPSFPVLSPQVIARLPGERAGCFLR